MNPFRSSRSPWRLSALLWNSQRSSALIQTRSGGACQGVNHGAQFDCECHWLDGSSEVAVFAAVGAFRTSRGQQVPGRVCADPQLQWCRDESRSRPRHDGSGRGMRFGQRGDCASTGSQYMSGKVLQACSQRMAAKWLGTAETFHKGLRRRGGGRRGCSQMCNRDTPGRARRRGTGGLVGLGRCASGEMPAPSETCVGVLITRRSQVCSSGRRCYGRHFAREAAA